MDKRYLVKHDHSEPPLFELFGELELNHACGHMQCDNVTGDEYWENEFRKQKGESMSTKKLMTDWLVAKEQEQEANARRFNIECALYKAVMETVDIKKEGTTNYELDGLKLTITSRMDVKVDQEKAAHYPELFVAKYEFSKTLNKNLSAEQIAEQENYIVVKPSKPTFKVEAKL